MKNGNGASEREDRPYSIIVCQMSNAIEVGAAYKYILRTVHIDKYLL